MIALADLPLMLRSLAPRQVDLLRNVLSGNVVLWHDVAFVDRGTLGWLGLVRWVERNNTHEIEVTAAGCTVVNAFNEAQRD